MSTFTPGPWAISSTGSVVSASGGYVAEAYDGLPGTDTDLGIAAANAALIAAAPALYEALKELDALPVQQLSHGVDSTMRPVSYMAYSAYEVQRIVRAVLSAAKQD